MNKLKDFGKGFLKGTAVSVFLLVVFNLTINKLFLANLGGNWSVQSVIILTIITFIIALHLIRRHKQPYAWFIIVMLFNAYMLPFLFGSVEYHKKHNDSSI